MGQCRMENLERLTTLEKTMGQCRMENLERHLQHWAHMTKDKDKHIKKRNTPLKK